MKIKQTQAIIYELTVVRYEIVGVTFPYLGDHVGILSRDSESGENFSAEHFSVLKPYLDP